MVNMAHRIRSFLMQNGQGSPYDFWVATGRRYNYMTVLRYFHILRFLGLIELVGTKLNKKKSPIKEHVYRLVPDKINHPCWDYPWPCYWDRKGIPDRIPLTYRVLGYYPWR